MVTTTSDPWQPRLEGRTDLVLGCGVSCSDGACGRLQALVLDPSSGRVTELVVRSRRGLGKRRLVPVEFVESTAGGVWRRCDLEAFDRLEGMEHRQYDPSQPPDWAADEEEALGSFAWVGAAGMPGLGGARVRPEPHYVLVDNVPPGDVLVRQHEDVRNSEAVLGSVAGVLVDPADHRATHVLLNQGHAWHRRRTAIPMSAVSRVGDEVTISLSETQVRDLPQVEMSAAP
jgi:sporulation protein YlmC with PRC-barrel domain